MKCILIFAAALFAGTAYGQRSVDDVLREVEAASKELKAQRELTAAQKMEAQTGKYLANPSVEFESLWGGAERIRNSELTVMQAFDFPSAYASRNKIAKLRSSYYDTEGAALRQQLLLDAKTLCIQIVHLNRMKEFLSERVVNAERLDSAYRRKFAIGEANILECNKIGVELISAKTEYNLNEAELLAKCQQLATLTGTESDRFSGLVYPTVESLPAFEQLSALYMEQNPQVQSLQQQVSVDKQSVSLNRSLSLPKFEMGYRHDFGGEGRFKGFKVGMSIPLFENKNKVKAARAQAASSAAQLESVRLNAASELRQLYDQAVTLRESMRSMESVLLAQNNLSMLNKALDAGQITVIEYITEIGVLYQSRQMQLQLERDYNLITAQLFRFEL